MSLKVYKSIRFLLENCADYKKTSTNNEFLPICYGIHDGREKMMCIELLLEHIEKKEGRQGMIDYINNNNNSEGFTALHKACYSKFYDAVKLFLKCGADPQV